MDLQSIELLTIPDSGASFVGKDFRAMMKPCVYVFLSGLDVLYVGYSQNGASRPFSPHHRQARIAQKDCSEVRIFPCPTMSCAKQLERILISRLKPTINVHGSKYHVRQLLGVSRS